MKYLKLLSVLLCTSSLAIQAQGKLFKENTNTRLISTSTNEDDHGADDITFTAAAYDQKANTMYAGAAGTGKTLGSVVKVNQNSDDASALVITALAPEKATVNGTAETTNPLYSKKIAAMALAGTGSSLRLGAVDSATVKKLVTINNLTDGSVVSQTPALNGPTSDGDAGIIALAGTTASTPQFFAVVTDDSTKTWATAGTADTDRGLAFISLDPDNALKQMDHDDITKTAVGSALEIPISKTAGVIAVSAKTNAGAQFATDTGVDMYWDANLERLFIGLNQVQPNAVAADENSTEATYINSVLVAGIDDDNALFVKSIVDNFNTKAATVFASKGANIVGTLSCDGTSTYNVAAKKVRTMHTSTNKDYLIVNGGANKVADIENTNAWVYALPIMPAGDANAGQLALTDDSDDFVVLATAAPSVNSSHSDEDFTDDERLCVIGVGPEFLGSGEATETIQDMNVIGDTVYVSIAGDTDNVENGNIGIYQSTALFNEHGLIMGWTPWQRASGYNDTSHEPIKFGLNADNGGFIFLGSSEIGNDTFNMNAWGKTYPTGGEGSKLNIADLANEFTANEGIFKLISFPDKTTPGFNGLHVLVALAGNKVVLRGTGPAADNKYTLTDDTLTEIAPLTSAAFVCEQGEENSGYLLIGGLNGLVRIGHYDGSEYSGYPYYDAEDAEDFPGLENLADLLDSDELTYQKIDGFTNVIDLKAALAGSACAVTTLDKVSVIYASNADNPDLVLNDTSDDVVPLTLEKSFFMDTCVTETAIFSITTEGLTGLKLSDGTEIEDFPTLKGHPLKLQFLQSSHNNDVTSGTLYVLTGDRSKGTGFIYRLKISEATFDYIDKDDENNIKPYKELNQFFHSFFVDNHIIYLTRSEETDNTDKLHMLINTNNDTDAIVVLDDQLSFEDTTSKKYIGHPVRLSSTGNMVVPGSFGLRIND